MGKRITKFRRDRWRDQVLVIGKRLDELHRERAITGSDYLDSEIDNLEKQRKGLLQKLKETA